VPVTNDWERINALPGIGGAFGLLGVKWGGNGIGLAPPTAITWNFPNSFSIQERLDLSSPQRMSEAVYRAEIEEAMAEWESYANIRLMKISDNEAADIGFSWGSIDGRGSTLGLALYYQRSSNVAIDEMTKVNIEFDLADYRSNANASAVHDSGFYGVALHEIGHALGLAHHDLSGGDIEGAQLLYGAANGAEARVRIGSDGGETFSHTSNTENVRMWGLGGNDVMRAGAGNDQLFGGAGNDRLEGNNGVDLLMDAFGNDQQYGGNGEDVLLDFSGNNRLDGGNERDVVVGGMGTDQLIGGNGDDALLADWYATDTWFGNDTLDGGAGNDRLMGGEGADTFVFRPNQGNDMIGRLALGSNNFVSTLSGADYQPGIDVLDVRAFNFSSANQALDALRTSGSNTIFDAQGMQVTINGIAPSAFTADDFLWA